MRYFSTFTGIGGFELGIKNSYELLNIRSIQSNYSKKSKSRNNTENKLSQWECVGYSEIDKHAIQVYQSRFPEHHNYGDITKIDTDTLPDFDLLVGGFPCQSFSIAGKRRGFEDTRGTMFFELARILRAKQPRLFIFENVKGLLSHDGGKTFATIISAIDELGYDCEWQVLNSKNHGVPQNRERIFIIGHLRGTPRPKVFPFGQTNGASDESHLMYVGSVSQRDFAKDGKKLSRNSPQGSRVYDTDGIMPCLAKETGGHGRVSGLLAIPVLTPDRPHKRQNGRRFKEDGDVSFTLTAQDKYGIFDGMKIRRLTPVECERLQGYPDGWTDCVSDSQRYKCLGNAVTVNVVKSIIENICPPHPSPP